MTFAATEAAGLTRTRWVATGVNNGKGAVSSVVAGTTLTAIFAEAGTVAGSGGCNDYSGPYTSDASTIKIGPLAATRMACTTPAGVDEQETQFFAAMGAATRYTSPAPSSSFATMAEHSRCRSGRRSAAVDPSPVRAPGAADSAGLRAHAKTRPQERDGSLEGEVCRFGTVGVARRFGEPVARVRVTVELDVAASGSEDRLELADPIRRLERVILGEVAQDGRGRRVQVVAGRAVVQDGRDERSRCAGLQIAQCAPNEKPRAPIVADASSPP